MEISRLTVHTRSGSLIALRTVTDLRQALESYLSRADMLTVTFTDGDKTKTVDLRRAPSLIPRSLRVKFYRHDGSPAIENMDGLDIGYSFLGHLGDNPSSSAQFTFRLNEIRGVVKVGSSVISLKSVVNDGEMLAYVLSRSPSSEAGKRACGNHGASAVAGTDINRRWRRELRLPAQRNVTTRYIEIYVVASKGVVDRTGSTSATVQRMIDIINYASSLYKQLNIYLALVQVEVWSNSDPFPVDGAVDDVLHDFSKYRTNNINPETRNDNAQMFVANMFADDTIGRGSNTMCSNTGSEAIIADLDDSDIIAAATTMAHELGHNLGLQHDDEIVGQDCTCPHPDSNDEKCIMVSVTDSELI